VASPAPFQKAWVKFTRPLSDVGIVVESLPGRPEGTPELLPGRVSNASIQINLQGALEQDVQVAAAIAFVDKIWLDANQVHKWSIEFSRFDDLSGAWVPSPSKRIAETEDRLLFAVAVPGYSTIAITGSTALPDRPFEVTELRVTSETAGPGDEVTITAVVANTGSESGAFGIALWLNNSIEDAGRVVVPGGGTAEVSFVVSKPVGSYSVRVDRQLAEFEVVAPANPSVGYATPTGMLLVMLSALGALLAISGALVLARSRRA